MGRQLEFVTREADARLAIEKCVEAGGKLQLSVPTVPVVDGVPTVPLDSNGLKSEVNFVFGFGDLKGGIELSFNRTVSKNGKSWILPGRVYVSTGSLEVPCVNAAWKSLSSYIRRHFHKHREPAGTQNVYYIGPAAFEWLKGQNHHLILEPAQYGKLGLDSEGSFC